MVLLNSGLVLTCILLAFSGSVYGGKYLFSSEKIVEQKLSYDWNLYIVTGLPEYPRRIEAHTENVVLDQEPLSNATWNFSIVADQRYGAQLYANYVTRSPFLLCDESTREYHEYQGVPSGAYTSDGFGNRVQYWTTREPSTRGHGHGRGHGYGYRTSTSSYPYDRNPDGESRYRHGTTRPPRDFQERDWERESYRTTTDYPYDSWTTRPPTTDETVRGDEAVSDSWISTWDLIVGSIVLTSEKNAVEGPAAVLLKPQFQPYRYEESPEGCQTVREYELRWDLDDLLDKLTTDLTPGKIVIPLGLQFKFQLISLRDNSEAIKQYNAAFSKNVLSNSTSIIL